MQGVYCYRLYTAPIALLTPERPGPERPAEANLSCCCGTMITCNHGYRRSALYAFHIFRKRFDFEPLLNPNSLPACSLNSTNTDSGTRNWIGFMEASSGRTFSAITSGVTVAA